MSLECQFVGREWFSVVCEGAQKEKKNNTIAVTVQHFHSTAYCEQSEEEETLGVQPDTRKS